MISVYAKEQLLYLRIANLAHVKFCGINWNSDRLCGLVVRVSGY
jgi:hypothetical protein